MRNRKNNRVVMGRDLELAKLWLKLTWQEFAYCGMIVWEER